MKGEEEGGEGTRRRRVELEFLFSSRPSFPLLDSRTCFNPLSTQLKASTEKRIYTAMK